MKIYQGYGQRIEQEDVLLWDESYTTERPPNVPEDWVIYARRLPEIYSTIEDALDGGTIELSIIGEMASEGEPIWPHGIEDIETDEGIAVVVKYWAPPDEEPPVKTVVKKDYTGLIVGAASIGVALLATAAYVAGKK